MHYWTQLKTFVLRARRDEEGVTAVEYGLIAALIAGVIVTAVQGLGNGLNAEFQSIAGHFPTGS